MSVRHPAPDNTGPAAGQGSTTRRRAWWIVASAALAVVVVLLVVAGVAASNGTAPGAVGTSETSTPSPLATATTPATPSAVPSPPPTATTSPTVDTPAPTEAEGELAPPPAQAPVPLTDSAAAVPGVVFGVGTLEAVDGVARGPGEVGGPSLRFTVTVQNDTSETVSLASTVVNLFFGSEQSPATELTSSGGAPFPASVAPGATQQGVFVFAVPSDVRDQVRIAVDYSAGVPIVLFEGAAPR